MTIHVQLLQIEQVIWIMPRNFIVSETHIYALKFSKIKLAERLPV
uniref:Uncharacterized protein n=1 Tax=Arundo donax TaxID=35708 RepID=A0A0A9ADV2_ARUDO